MSFLTKAKEVRTEVDSQIEGGESRFPGLKFDLEHLTPYKSSWCQQFQALLWRSWHSIIKEPKFIQIRICEVFVSLPITPFRKK